MAAVAGVWCGVESPFGGGPRGAGTIAVFFADRACVAQEGQGAPVRAPGAMRDRRYAAAARRNLSAERILAPSGVEPNGC